MSIVTFEKHTEDLTEKEHEVLDTVADAIENILTQSREPVQQVDLARRVNAYLDNYLGLFNPVQVNSVRLRKFFNYLRSTGRLPIIATSAGCTISRDPEVIRKQIRSLEQRARQIQCAADGLKQYLPDESDT
jgi:hypothetical protein